MNSQKYARLVSVVFLVVGLVHLCRAVRGFDLIIGGYSLPMWASWLGILVAWYLAYEGYKLSK